MLTLTPLAWVDQGMGMPSTKLGWAKARTSADEDTGS